MIDKHENPIDYIFWCCENDFKPSQFDILNAKDEYSKLKNMNKFHSVCWVRINSRGDLYDPRLFLNPHLDESTVLPLYANEKEFKEKYGKLSFQ